MSCRREGGGGTIVAERLERVQERPGREVEVLKRDASSQVSGERESSCLGERKQQGRSNPLLALLIIVI